MKNISMKRKGDILTIKIDISKDYGPSMSSGKTVIIATTQGNVPLPGMEDYGFRLGLTLFCYPSGSLKQYTPVIPKATKRKRLRRKGSGKIKAR